MSLTKYYKKIILALLFLLAFFQANVVSAEKIGISIDQSVVAFSADPGTTQEVKLNILNTSTETQIMSVKFKDFVQGDNNQIVQVTEKNEQFGMKDWISAEEEEWFLPPSEKKEIKFKISIPQNAPIGAHYAIAAIQALPQIDGSNFQSTIVGGQIGVYVLVNVGGAVSGSGNLKKFDAPIIAGKNIPLKTEFENTGNILYIPHGEVKIQNMLTRKQEVLESEKHFIFPGTKYLFEMEWSPGSILGAYKAEAIFVDADGREHYQQRFFFGKLFFVIPFIFLSVCILLVWRIMRIRRSRGMVFNAERIC